MNKVLKSSVRVDNIGRIYLSVKMREPLGIECGEYVDVKTNGNVIVISNPNTVDLRTHIKVIQEAASDSGNITISEYRQLCELMNKLNSKNNI